MIFSRKYICNPIRCLIVFMVMVCVDLCLAGSEVDLFKEIFIRKNDSITIQISRKKFDPNNHILDEKNWKIDGVTPYGVDGYIVNPEKEIDFFTIIWNGNKIPIPKEMYKDCYSPNLKKVAIFDDNYNKEKQEQAAAVSCGITVKWDEKDDMLLISMYSNEWAAATYSVVWKISRYGVHSRCNKRFID